MAFLLNKLAVKKDCFNVLTNEQTNSKKGLLRFFSVNVVERKGFFFIINSDVRKKEYENLSWMNLVLFYLLVKITIYA